MKTLYKRGTSFHHMWQLMLLFAIFALAACSTGSDTAILSINLGKGSLPDKASVSIEQLRHAITLSGPTGKRSYSISGGGTIRATVAAGIWYIDVEAFLGSELYAKGSGSAEVRTGRNTSVTIYMTVVWGEETTGGVGGGPVGPVIQWVEIWDIDQLKQVSDNMGKNYKLMDDIIYTGIGTIPSGLVIEIPLGIDAGGVVTPFTGIFDGNGHTIQLNMIVAGGLPNYAGLFAVNGGTVRNLTLDGSILDNVASGAYFVGAVAGENTGIIDSIISTVTLNVWSSGGDVFVGGIVGKNNGGTIKECKNTIATFMAISGDSDTNNAHTGGITGQLNSGIIQNCTNEQSIAANTYTAGETAYAGGIAGSMLSGTIRNCSNIPTVNISAMSTSTMPGMSAYAGGITGYQAAGEILNCLNRMPVQIGSSSLTPAAYAGGITGISMGTIKNCYNTGDIQAYTTTALDTYTGGIVGKNDTGGSVFYCWAEGDVSALGTSNYVGGIAGVNNAQIANCVALNGTLTGLAPGRIWGFGSGTGINNWGHNNMAPLPGAWPNNTLIDQDGFDIALSGLNSASDTSFWNTGVIWTLHIIDPATDISPWVWSGTTPPVGLPPSRPVLYFEM